MKQELPDNKVPSGHGEVGEMKMRVIKGPDGSWQPEKGDTLPGVGETVLADGVERRVSELIPKKEGGVRIVLEDIEITKE